MDIITYKNMKTKTMAEEHKKTTYFYYIPNELILYIMDYLLPFSYNNNHLSNFIKFVYLYMKNVHTFQILLKYCREHHIKSSYDMLLEKHTYNLLRSCSNYNYFGRNMMSYEVDLIKKK